MDTADADDRALLDKLDRLNALVHARDPAIVDELWNGPGFRLVGSEVGDVVETREELATHMAALFAKPFWVSWAWRERKVTRHGDLAWIFAESEILIAYPDRTERKPYRLFAIFHKLDGRWHWRVFNGSEPVGVYS